MLTIQTREGPQDVEPLAERDGLAVHAGWGLRSDVFTITHVSSGLAVVLGLCASAGEAEAVLDDIAELWDWQRDTDDLADDPRKQEVKDALTSVRWDCVQRRFDDLRDVLAEQLDAFEATLGVALFAAHGRGAIA